MSAAVSARLGALFAHQLDQAGPNLSAAMRAYLLLGFAAGGVAMAPFRREIARCLAEDLAPELLAALGTLAVGAPAPLAEVSAAPPLPEDDDGDPLLSVGFAV